jgi:hypothetical protein
MERLRFYPLIQIASDFQVSFLEPIRDIRRNHESLPPPVQGDLLKPMLSSITAFGPIGTRPGLVKSSFRKTILSRQTGRVLRTVQYRDFHRLAGVQLRNALINLPSTWPVTGKP